MTKAASKPTRRSFGPGFAGATVVRRSTAGPDRRLRVRTPCYRFRGFYTCGWFECRLPVIVQSERLIPTRKSRALCNRVHPEVVGGVAVLDPRHPLPVGIF